VEIEGCFKNYKTEDFGTNVKSVLLHRRETWKVTQTLSHKLQIFVNRCLRIIIKSRWSEVISNHDPWVEVQAQAHINRNKEKEMEVIGHTHIKPPSDIARAAVEWNPQGTRKRERPRTTWRWTVLNELTPD
jgi:hypothetical protein